MYRRTRQNPTATIKDFTEGDIIPNAATAYVETLEPTVVAAAGFPGKQRVRLGDAEGPPFDPLSIGAPAVIDGGTFSDVSEYTIDGGSL